MQFLALLTLSMIALLPLTRFRSDKTLPVRMDNVSYIDIGSNTDTFILKDTLSYKDLTPGQDYQFQYYVYIDNKKEINIYKTDVKNFHTDTDAGIVNLTYYLPESLKKPNTRIQFAYELIVPESEKSKR